ncbi:hypothetical protein EV175_003368, partial [Coemansia sp. RSA 1933]
VYLHNPYYFMYATLMDERGERELNTLNDKKARTMTGSVVASLAHLKDVDGNDGAFFVFPDLSVRCEGVYKLKFSLFEIVGNQVFFCKSITSEMFTVYSAKKFPGMEESTRLTKLFAEQGLKIRVRKEQKSTRPKGARSRPIATAHHSGRNSPVSAQQQQHHHQHISSWGVVEHHRSATAGSIGYPQGTGHHHTDRPHHQQQPQHAQYAGTPMSVVSPPVGPANPGPSARLTPSGNNSYQQQQPVAGYPHPVPGTLSSPATAAPGSMPSRSELHSAQTHGIAQQQPQYQPHQQSHIFGGKQGHGSSRMMDQHGGHSSEPIVAQEHGEHPDHHMYRSLPQTLPSSSASSQALPPYRQQQQQQQQNQQHQQQQQQRHYYTPHRPWSPHHRTQHHFSPTHPSHAFGGESRYSPYNRQVDTPRDGRPHASSSSSSSGVRLNNLAGPPSVEGGITSPPEQHQFRHQTHGVPRAAVARNSSPDPMQRYQKSPSHQQQQHGYSSMVPTDTAPVATLPPIVQNQEGGSSSAFGQHPQQQQQPPPGMQKSQFVRSRSPEKRLSLPPFGAMNTRNQELAEGREAPPQGIRGETQSPAPQRRMMAVHSLLISDSSSPERTNGSSS